MPKSKLPQKVSELKIDFSSYIKVFQLINHFNNYPDATNIKAIERTCRVINGEHLSLEATTDFWHW
jgi:hypothetical protein